MQQTKKKTKSTSKKSFYWRTNKKKWTDTLFDSKLLTNPSLMTNAELAKALEEHQEWRIGEGKYFWREDPIKESAEIDATFLTINPFQSDYGDDCPSQDWRRLGNGEIQGSCLTAYPSLWF